MNDWNECDWDISFEWDASVSYFFIFRKQQKIINLKTVTMMEKNLHGNWYDQTISFSKIKSNVTVHIELKGNQNIKRKNNIQTHVLLWENWQFNGVTYQLVVYMFQFSDVKIKSTKIKTAEKNKHGTKQKHFFFFGVWNKVKWEH